MRTVTPLFHFDAGRCVSPLAQKLAEQTVFQAAVIGKGFATEHPHRLRPDDVYLAAARISGHDLFPFSPISHAKTFFDGQAPFLINPWVNVLSVPLDLLEVPKYSANKEFLSDILAKLNSWENRFLSTVPLEVTKLPWLVNDITICLHDFLEAYADLRESQQQELALAYADYFTGLIMPMAVQLLETVLGFTDVVLADSIQRDSIELPRALTRLYNTLTSHLDLLRGATDKVWMAVKASRDSVVHDLIRQFADRFNFLNLGIDSDSYLALETSGIVSLRDQEMTLNERCQELKRSLILGDALTEQLCINVADLTTEWLQNFLRLQRALQSQTVISGAPMVLKWWWEAHFYRTLQQALTLLASVTKEQLEDPSVLNTKLHNLGRSLDAILHDPNTDRIFFKDHLSALRLLYLVPACFAMGDRPPAVKNETIQLLRAVNSQDLSFTALYRSILEIENNIAYLLYAPRTTKEEYTMTINQGQTLLYRVHHLAIIVHERRNKLTEPEIDLAHHVFLDLILPMLANLFDILLVKPVSFWGNDFKAVSALCDNFYSIVVKIGALLDEFEDTDLPQWMEELQPHANAVCMMVGNAKTASAPAIHE